MGALVPSCTDVGWIKQLSIRLCGPKSGMLAERPGLPLTSPEELNHWVIGPAVDQWPISMDCRRAAGLM